jgi:TonB family protein
MLPTHPRASAAPFAGLALLALALLAVPWALAGCRVSESEPVVAGHHELCCKAANPDNLGFVGCRASSSCRTSERVWVRGPVTCEPPDAQNCAGGRCCKLDLEALALLELDAEAVVDAPTIEALGEATPREPAPAPALIVPVPLDWQPRPTPVAIAKLLCPATVERGIVGEVLLDIEVDANGHVTAAEVRSGIDPQCDTLARDALLHAEFEPARTPEGVAIASSLTWVYAFTRDGSE